MKPYKFIYLLVASLIVVACFLPWVYIPSINATLTGLNGAVANYGRPGIMNIFFNLISIAFFLAPSIWAKRINVFVCAFNFSWSIRNYLVVTQCAMGECPEKKWGIFVLLLLSFILLLLSFFPQMKLRVTA